jgi:hypothetical protein
MAKKNVNRRLFIYINGKQVKNTLNGVRQQMRKVQGQLGNITRGTDEYKKKSEELRQITKVYNEMRQEIKGIPSLLKKIKTELGSVGTILLGIFSVNAITSYFSTLKEKVNVLRDLKNIISQITQLQGQELEMVTARVQALADGFDEDTQKMTEAANNLSKQMSIDFTQALDLIEQGYYDGANANGEFLDKVREYPALLKEAGLSSEQSIKLMSEEVKKGIYSDKGVDAIKEANIRIREMTPATKQAIDAIGLSSKSIEEDLKSGRKTIFEVIQSVSQQMAVLPPQSQLVGQAIADIFGGPGEDAGVEYLTSLHEIDLSLNDLSKKTDEYTKAKQLEIKANESLNNIWVQLTTTGGKLNVLWQQLKLQVANVISFFARLIGVTDDADGSIDGLRQKVIFMSKVLLVGVTAFFSYNAALKVMSFLSKVAAGNSILHTAAVRANALGAKAAKAATLAYIIVINLLSGNLKKATVAMRVFNMVTKMNPIGLLIGAVMGLIAAYQLFSKDTSEAARKQEALNNVKKKAASLFAEEESKLKKLLIVAQNEALSKERRQKAIEELNKLSPKLLGNLTLENINTVEGAKAIEMYVRAMKQRIKLKALEFLIEENIKKQRETEAKDIKEFKSWYESMNSARKDKAQELQHLVDQEKVYTEQYAEEMQKQADLDAEYSKKYNSDLKIREMLLKSARLLRIKNLEKLNNEQLRLEIQKATERNNKLAASNKKAAEDRARREKAEQDRIAKQKKEAFERALKELNDIELKLQREKELNAKQGLERELLQIDFKYKSLLEKFKGHEDKIKEVERVRDEEKEMLREQRRLASEARAKEIEEQNRIAKEEQRLLLEAEEIENEIARADRLLEITRDIALQELDIERQKALEKLRIAGASEAEIAAVKERFSIQEKKINDQFQKGKDENDKKSKEREKKILNDKLNAYKNMFGGISQLLGEHTAAGKAAAIAQATINTWQGVTEVWKAPAVLPEPFNTASKVVATGTTIASGLKAVGVIKKTSTSGYKDGGFTESLGFKDHTGEDVAGVVHADEYVIPKFVMNSTDPAIPQVINYLENKRLEKVGFNNGGHTSTPTPEFESETTTQLDETYNPLLFQITRLNDILESGLVANAFIGDDEIDRYQEREQKLNRSRENSKIQ